MGFANLKKRVGDNTIFSKKLLLFIAGIFIVSASFIYAQSESTETEKMSDVRAEEQMLIIPSSDTEVSAEQNVKTNNVWQFIKLILVLILVIACIYGIVWLLKKSTGTNFQSGPYLKKVAAVNLSPGKSVYIVSTPTQAFVVGAGDNSVNLIGEINDKELIDTMNLAAENQPAVKQKDFMSIISAFLPGQKTEEPDDNEEFEDYFDNAAKNATETIRQSRKQIRDNNNTEDDGQ